MSRSGAVIVHEGAEVLAEAVASRLINRLADVQAQRGEASIVLTGGRIAARVYQYVLESEIRSVVDWSKVDFWWGDERFLPSGDPERNETQARAAFLDKLLIDPERVHPMAASDVVDTPEE
ncbi:MAG: 6-phosphogluconolactonase, partial [Glycomyces artemisiae]|nr:6-phosphogluconolactonase [Glycomyces artemisiae]